MYARGDVVRSLDPFTLGDDAERYWLILDDERHPLADEQFIEILSTALAEPPGLPTWKPISQQSQKRGGGGPSAVPPEPRALAPKEETNGTARRHAHHIS